MALLAQDENALELAVYNWTHDSFCGTHYDAVLSGSVATPHNRYLEHPLQSSSSDAVVPPPPPPHREERPHKRLRFKQCIDERALDVKANHQSITEGSQELSLSVASEDFYRMAMRSVMEACMTIVSEAAAVCICATTQIFRSMNACKILTFQRHILAYLIYIYIYIYLYTYRATLWVIGTRG